MLTIYVDDFLMAGPSGNLKQGWDLISGVLDIEEEGPNGRKAGRYLGCDHKTFQVDTPKGKVTIMEYDMEDYLKYQEDKSEGQVEKWK